MATTLMSVTNTSTPPTPRTSDSEPLDYTNCIHINDINENGHHRTYINNERHDKNNGDATEGNIYDENTPILLNIFLIRKKRYRVFYNAGKLVWERYQSKKGKK